MDVADHMRVAEALTDLSKQGVLIVGSGFATHKGGRPGAPPPAWATSFKEWLNDALTNDKYTSDERKSRLLASVECAPYMNNAHPRIEHFLPLIMCCAAASYKAGKLLYSEFAMESLLNEHYLFKCD